MRDDPCVPAGGRPLGCTLLERSLLALACAAGWRSAALADTFHGSAEVQYQNIDREQPLPTQDTWNKVLQMDYANTLRGQLALSSSFRFVEQTVAGQPDRVRVPEGSLRLAHRNFGFSTSFRPAETRDAQGLTTRRQDLVMSAYAQKAKLPTLSGSWVRSRNEQSLLFPGSTTVSRSLSSQYQIPHVSFRATYGDRFLEDVTEPQPHISENHLALGSTSQFQVGRAPVSVQYDFSQSRAFPSVGRSQLSRAHLATTGTSFTLDPKTTASLSYSYRWTQLVGIAGGVNQEHNGGLALARTINPVLQLGGGAGVRSALLGGGRTVTERFVDATASAQGQARPGWRMSGNFTHSVNWLPDLPVRPSDDLQGQTTLRLAKGLDLRGDLSLGTAKLVAVPPETTAFARQYAVQSGVGVSAYPLRTVYLDANVSHSRAGPSFTSGGLTSTSYSTGLRLTPSSAIQLNGRWGLVDAAGTRGTTGQAGMQWTVAGTLQLSASYSRARQQVALPTQAFTGLQESFTGQMTMRLAQELNGSFQYSESNRGQPNRVRQLSANLVRRFGN